MDEMQYPIKRQGKFNIFVKCVQGDVLKFSNVQDYEIDIGHIIIFFDNRHQQVRRFHTSHCEIQEVLQ